jgi:putative transcriptional regulator
MASSGTGDGGRGNATINSIETGRYDPSLPLAIKIARLFGKHVEEVFLYDESELAAPADTDY